MQQQRSYGWNEYKKRRRKCGAQRTRPAGWRNPKCKTKCQTHTYTHTHRTGSRTFAAAAGGPGSFGAVCVCVCVTQIQTATKSKQIKKKSWFLPTKDGRRPKQKQSNKLPNSNVFKFPSSCIVLSFLLKPHEYSQSHTGPGRVGTLVPTTTTGRSAGRFVFPPKQHFQRPSRRTSRCWTSRSTHRRSLTMMKTNC